MSWGSFRPYVSVARRRANAAAEAKKLQKGGKTLSPVELTGPKIANTFWGSAWCDNLASYSDFANRLPRGRTYVRNGSVIDLKIEKGLVTALVQGSSLYKIKVPIKPLPDDKWENIKSTCAGKIGSLIELLQGKLSARVMEVVTDRRNGLFPAPAEINLDCSCPDYADLCKHVAASLYGVGARLDQQPELLFLLRGVDHMDLISHAGSVDPVTAGGGGSGRTLDEVSVADVFGIEMAAEAPPVPVAAPAQSSAAANVRGIRKPRAAKAHGPKTDASKAAMQKDSAAQSSAAKLGKSSPASRRAAKCDEPDAPTIEVVKVDAAKVDAAKSARARTSVSNPSVPLAPRIAPAARQIRAVKRAATPK